MADVFVSYARSDKARVAPLVTAIEAQGWSVWWDGPGDRSRLLRALGAMIARQRASQSATANANPAPSAAATGSARVAIGVLPFVTIALFVVTARPVIADTDPRAGADAESPSSARTLAVPHAPGPLIQPEDLARLLADTTIRQPMVLHVGYKVLFRGGHIPGSRHIGPASTPDGVAALKQVLREIPRQQEIVLYCGCCPWADCPNVRPALQAAREIGLKNVSLLLLPNNLQLDWIDKGLPISKGDQ